MNDARVAKHNFTPFFLTNSILLFIFYVKNNMVLEIWNDKQENNKKRSKL